MTVPTRVRRDAVTRAALAAAALAAVAATSACGSSTQHGDALLQLPVPGAVTVTTRHVDGLGTILVDGRGRTLYMFPPDAGGRVSCTGACAGTWPPLVIADGRRPTAGRGVDAEDLSTLPDPNSGARVVTYSGYPLYRYASDLSAGSADGQALFNNGGPWYVLDPNGQPVTKAVGSGR